MNDTERAPEQPAVQREAGLTPGARLPRRRTILLTLIAAISATAAVGAIGGSALAMRPAGAVTGSATVPPNAASATSAPSATAAALALELTSAAGSGAPLAPKPAGTPSGTDPTFRPGPVVMPCNAAGTSSSPVRPCPPGPCMTASAPSGKLAPNPCPPPPPSPQPCAYFSGAATGSTAMRACPPPPCYDPSFAARPCPTPEPCPATTNGDGRGTATGGAMMVRPCPRMVMLTEKDSGRTITVKAGTWILVRLSGGGVWTEPVTSNGAVVTRTGSGHDRNGGSYGSFRGASAGTADLTAMDQPSCAPKCKIVTRSWTVHITVAP